MIPSRYPPGIKGKHAKTMQGMHFGEQNAPFCECFVCKMPHGLLHSVTGLANTLGIDFCLVLYIYDWNHGI
jgi:hypothetical protein